MVVAADLVPNEKGDDDGAVDKLGAAGVNPNAGGLEGAPLSVSFFSSPLGFADPNANPPPAPAPPLDGNPPKGEVDAPAAFSPPATSIFFPPNEKPPALSKRGLRGGGWLALGGELGFGGDLGADGALDIRLAADDDDGPTPAASALPLVNSARFDSYP